MRMRLAFALVVALTCSACTPHYDGTMRDTIARLPSGDEITSEADIIACGLTARTTATVTLWRRKTASEALVHIEGKGEARVREVGKVLTVKGDTAPFFYSLHSKPQPPAPELRTSADGNRAWLIRDGKVIASFDYEHGTALFGPEGQPSWAVTD